MRAAVPRHPRFPRRQPGRRRPFRPRRSRRTPRPPRDPGGAPPPARRRRRRRGQVGVQRRHQLDGRQRVGDRHRRRHDGRGPPQQRRRQPEHLAPGRRGVRPGVACRQHDDLRRRGQPLEVVDEHRPVGHQQRREHRVVAGEPAVADEVGDVGATHRRPHGATTAAAVQQHPTLVVGEHAPASTSASGTSGPATATTPRAPRSASPGSAATARATAPGRTSGRNVGSSPHGRSWRPAIGLSATGPAGSSSGARSTASTSAAAASTVPGSRAMPRPTALRCMASVERSSDASRAPARPTRAARCGGRPPPRRRRRARRRRRRTTPT